MPQLVVAPDPADVLDQKTRELNELNERLKIRIGQIERAEARLLSLQEQILALPTLESRLIPQKDADLSSSEVFRVDVSSEEPLRISPSPSSSPRGTLQLSHSTTAVSPSPMRSSFSLDVATSPAPTHAAMGARIGQSLTPPVPLSGAQPASPSRFNIRSSTNIAMNDEKDRFNFFSSSSSSSSATGSHNSISFTIIKSWFGSSSSDEKSKVQFNIDASQIQISERVTTLSSVDYAVHRASVGGWVCNVKIINLGVNDSTDTRFFKRVKLLETLPSHANISRYYFHDMAEDGRCCRIFTEWFHTNLADVLQKRAEEKRPFSAAEIEFVLMEIVKGSEFLHSYSILHRNLSPHNIHVLLDERGEIARVAIANLDSAKVITDRVNAKGATMRDPRYCAPEVVTAKKTGAYSFPSDIWSLGMVAYSLLTLKSPWHEETNAETLASLIARGDRPKWGDMEAHGDEYAPIVEIFNECTRVRPDDRPTVSILKQALITKASISEHRRASQLNIGFTYQPRREASTFFENFLVIGCPIGLRKPEEGQPTILYQYPPSSTISHPEILMNFSMAQSRPSTRIKRTNSMSNVNQKLFASRDMTEHSSSACIFTMMEGEELRYGVCVYFEEPVDIVPSFMSTQHVISDAKKDPVAVDAKRISKYTHSLATPPSKRKVLALPAHVALRGSGTTAAPASALPTLTEGTPAPTGSDLHLPSSSLLAEPRRRRHQRTASDGSALKLIPEPAEGTSTAAGASNGTPSLGHVKFTYRCYMLFSKWPFFKLHFEVLWAILAQERLARISAPEPVKKPAIITVPEPSSLISTDSNPSVQTAPVASISSSSESTGSTSTSPPSAASPLAANLSAMRSKARSVSMAPALLQAHLHSEGEHPAIPHISTAGISQEHKDSITDSTGQRSPTPKRTKRSAAASPSGESKDVSLISRTPDEPEPTEENCLILRMLGTYHRTPVPTDKHQTTVTLASHPPILYTPGDVTEAVAEWCFPCMFRTLSVKTLLKLFTAVLLEEKIVMFSADTGVLTSCVTGLTALLRPYAWQGTFLPIVPPTMMAVVESPIPYVAGIAESHPQLEGMDGGVVVNLSHDIMTGRSHYPRLPHSDRLYDAFAAYASAIANTGPPSNPCKSSVSDGDSLAKLLAALSLWHNHLLEQIAAVPAVGLDFKWGNTKEVEQVVRALSSSERDFYREFFETQHFSIISDRLNTVICQLRSRKDHQKHVQRLENIFTQ